MKLTDLLNEVKDEKLSQEQLESYLTSLSNLNADLQIEIATLKKDKALFEAADPNISVAKAKVMWKASKKGQRLILLEGYSRATATQMRSLKNRIYALL